MNTRRTGSFYERYAADYLKQNGYRLVASNYRCPYGELDLIAEEGEYLCFIEVKYRASIRGGYPQEAVNAKKQCRIRQTAAWYLRTERAYGRKCRFDVVAVSPPHVWLIKNAFGGI